MTDTTKHGERPLCPPAGSLPASAWPQEAAFPEKPLNAWLPLRAQLLLVLGSYILGRLYLSLWVANTDWLCFGFTALFLAWGELALRLREQYGAPRPDAAVRREALFWAFCTLAVGAALSLGRCGACAGWALLFWHGFAVYWVLCRAGLLTQRSTGAAFLWDAANALLFLPFSGLFLRARTLWAGIRCAAHRRRRPAGRQMGVTLLCLAAALPFLLWAARLLAGADETFGLLVEACADLFRLDLSERVWYQLRLLLWSLPAGAYFYGLVGGSARQISPRFELADLQRESERLRVAPRAAAVLILAAFCGLYTVFFGVQAGYLFGGFGGILPAGFSPAQYARQGFYELCCILVMNFGLLTACARLSACPVRRSPAVRRLCILLMAESLLFCGTVLAKIALYISIFGFTPRRLLAGWAVIVFAAAAVLAISTLVRPHPAIRKLVWFAAASFVVLCFLY